MTTVCYFEGCNCDVICPCIFMAHPDEGFCDVIPAWHIKNGNFGNISLDDLNVSFLSCSWKHADWPEVEGCDVH